MSENAGEITDPRCEWAIYEYDTCVGSEFANDADEAIQGWLKRTGLKNDAGLYAAPLSPAAQDGQVAQAEALTSSKRRTSRFAYAAATMGQVMLSDSGERRQTRIANLSAGGIGLNLNCCLPAGTPVTIFLNIPDQDVTVNLSARVIHSTKESDDSYRVGCEFATTLKPDVLDILL